MTRKEQLLKQYSDYLKMRNYAESTYKAYMGTVRAFWKWSEKMSREPGFDKSNAVQAYLAYRIDQQMDYSTVNGDYSALQWFYKHILNRAWNVEQLVRPRKEIRLPKYITPKEVGKLVSVTPCRKHKVIFMLFYSTGLRLSELRMLKWEDVNFEEGVIHVRKGKGAKERLVVLHEEMADLLIVYRGEQRIGQQIIFEGRTCNKEIASRSVQHAFNESRVKAGLPDWVTPHVMRHSFATSSLKNGTDLLTLKTLMGHKRLTTTARYLHLCTAYLKQSYNPLKTKHLLTPIEGFKRPER